MSASIAVVIPVFNRRRQVIEALESVAQQTLAPKIVLVVDDGSTTAVRDAVERWQAERATHLEMRVISQANRGAAHARNTGLAAAPSVEFVAFLDSDDLWPRDFLERAYVTLQADPQAVAATADRVYESSSTAEILSEEDSREIATDATTWILLRGGGIGSASLLRVQPLRAVGGYDDSLATGHDSALFLRLSLLGRWLHITGLPVRYRTDAESSSGEEDHLRYRFHDYRLRWAEIDEAFIREGGGRQQVRRAVYARHLARRWRLGGEQLARHGDRANARDCFWRSLSWRIKWKTAVRLSSTFGWSRPRETASASRP